MTKYLFHQVRGFEKQFDTAQDAITYYESQLRAVKKLVSNHVARGKEAYYNENRNFDNLSHISATIHLHVCDVDEYFHLKTIEL